MQVLHSLIKLDSPDVTTLTGRENRKVHFH